MEAIVSNTGDLIRESIRVLIIDDEHLLVNLMKMNLCKLRKYQQENIYSAENGLKALDLLEELHKENKFPHIIFADLKMPGLDGIDFYTQIADNHKGKMKDVVKYLLTGISFPQEKAELEKKTSKIGVEIIYKPFKYSHILDRAEEKLMDIHKKYQ